MLGVAPQAGLVSLELEDITSEPPAAPSSGSLDLPARAEQRDWGLPELVGPKGAAPRLNRAGPPRPGQAPSGVLPGSPAQVDLPPIERPSISVKPESAGLPALALDLPSRASGKEPSGRAVDLPDLAPVSTGVGLPDLSVGLPDLGASLPDLGSSLPDLSAGLPEPGAGLPRIGGSLPDVAAALPMQGFGGLESGEGGPRSIQLPSFGPSGSDPPRESEADANDLFGSPPRGLDSEDPFGTGPTHRAVTDPSALARAPAPPQDDDEFDAFPTEIGKKPARDTGTGTAAMGSVGYGEVALDGGVGDLALGEAVERPMAGGEVGAAPGAAAMTAAVTRPGAADALPPKVKKRSAGISRKVRIAALAAGITVLLGGALSVLPTVGPFGAYWVIDLVRSGQYADALAHDLSSADPKMATDRAGDWDMAFRTLERGRENAPRYKPRAAAAAYVGLMRQLKFGSDTKSGALARALLDSLKDAEVDDAAYLDVARLAGQAVDRRGKDALLPEAKLRVSPEHTLLGAEVLTREGYGQKALALWQELRTKKPSLRVELGIARTLSLLGKDSEADKIVSGLLQTNPSHLGVRLLAVELALKRRSDGQVLEAQLAEIGQSKDASQFEKSRAQTLEGELLLKRSRLKQAEEAFNAALKLDAGNASAQRGLASVLFEAGRFSEALARFEAALGLAPEDLQIQLGIVRSKIRLEQHQDAAKVLARLTTAYPESTPVQYWVGRSKEALGEKEAAQEAYQKAVQAGEDVPELVEATVALTRLLGQAGKHDEATKAIEAAVVRFPNEPRVYRALGELAEGRGNYEDAVTNYDRALSLDPSNVGVRFARSVALRKARRFEEAARELDAVEHVEKGYPGLSLERGNLYEAAGRTEEALRAYESALSQAPNDPDLMLRVGCGKANAGRTKDAQVLLNKVLADRAMSAEVNFCLGMAQFKEGKDLPMARRTLERALSLDSTRPEYHLYSGWVAIELKDYSSASRAFDRALELDQSLADAYWLRGMLRVRQGAVDDAERDLKRSILLSPARYEAHATLAEAYLQMGKEPEALAEFERAASGGALEPHIEYRFGKILLDNHRAPEARTHLERALAKKRSSPREEPPWVWDAHRLLAMTMGNERAALEHWQAFVEYGPSDSPYRVDAVRAMKAIVTSLGH